MWRFCLILLISLSVTHADESVNPCDILTGNQTFAPNPRGCSLYYYCGDNNIPKPGQCPIEPVIYYFSFETQSCELPEDVDCTIDDVLWNTTCPSPGISKVPHQYSCSEYSVCLDNQPIDRSCPAGLHFSPYDQECVDPNIANCMNDGVTCQGSNPFVPKYIPNSRNCSSYYICFNNILHQGSCGINQVFDSTTNRCVPKGTVTCEQTLNPDLEVPNSLTYDCSNVKNGSRIPHPEHCKFWFWCVNGRSQLFWCGKDALFDSESRLCTEKNQTVCAHIDGQGQMTHDLTDQTELKPTPASQYFTMIQPKLRVMHSKAEDKVETKNSMRDNIGVGIGNRLEGVSNRISLRRQLREDDKVETKQETFYGLF
ncbi:peritrophin-48-like [Chironomus tepperi]|uniref:peritrophin-48-like n=1 Tax=Chironomus tepperi TaxID=113505 RepID=UPI00391F1C7A